MKRILFVDDEPKVLEGLQRTLRTQRQQWEMAFAPGGEPALSMLDALPFDVVVSDMRMPGMDGAALLRIVREKHPNILRIILSGYTDLEAAFRGVPVAHQFLLKPCDPETLRAAIERATSLSDVLNSKLLANLVGSMQELPSLPRTYVELREIVADPASSLDKVVRVVERDVAISAKILQLVNSAFFGTRKDIVTIKAAVSYLGIDIIQNLVLSVEVFRSFTNKWHIPGFSFDEVHEHSRLTAKIAGAIPISTRLPGGAVVAALLHDVGKLVLAERAPQHLSRALAEANQDRRPLHTVEEELMGASHAEIGAYLLSLWGLPSPVVEAVAHHHHPERVPHGELDILAAVHLADILAHEISSPPSESVDDSPSPLASAYVESLGVKDQIPVWRSKAEEMAHVREGA